MPMLSKKMLLSFPVYKSYFCILFEHWSHNLKKKITPSHSTYAKRFSLVPKMTVTVLVTIYSMLK